jgi:hypothetical protein
MEDKSNQRVQTLYGIIEAARITIEDWEIILSNLTDPTYKPEEGKEVTHTVEQAKRIIKRYNDAIREACEELAG